MTAIYIGFSSDEVANAVSSRREEGRIWALIELGTSVDTV